MHTRVSYIMCSVTRTVGDLTFDTGGLREAFSVSFHN